MHAMPSTNDENFPPRSVAKRSQSPARPVVAVPSANSPRLLSLSVSTYTRAGPPTSVLHPRRLELCNAAATPGAPPTRRRRARARVMRDLEEFRGSGPPSHGGEGGAGSVSWWSDDPEAKRRRRVAGYKAYAVEARVKASLRRGLRWIKDRCTGLVRRH